MNRNGKDEIIDMTNYQEHDCQKKKNQPSPNKALLKVSEKKGLEKKREQT